MQYSKNRHFTIDALKVLASQIIVLHHWVLYSPFAERIEHLNDTLFDLLMWEGRYVVQVFLVIGGYLSIQSLQKMWRQPQAPGLTDLLNLIKQRFVRLGKPYWVALCVALLAAVVAEMLLLEQDLRWGQKSLEALAHVLLLHDIVGVEAWSAGVWYVAIDFQLFALTALLVWLSPHLARLTHWRAQTWAKLLLATFTVLALLLFNRMPQLDEWAIYFFGSYGLGMMAYWAGHARHNWQRVVWIALGALALGLALWIDWRERLLLAGLTALLLMVHDHVQPKGMKQGWLSGMADDAYAVFLLHYPVLVLVVALCSQFALQPALQALALPLFWGLSMVLGRGLTRQLAPKRKAA